jgi:hypothetical protein
MTPTPPSLPQTIIFALSRGLQPYLWRALVDKRWIVVDGTERRRDGSTRDRYALPSSSGQQALASSKYLDKARRRTCARYALTSSVGQQACVTSKYLNEARRRLDAGKESRPWQGMMK